MLSTIGNLKHDATVLRVIGWLSINGHRITNTIASFEVDFGMSIGNESETFATGPDPAVDTDEIAWLWKMHHFSIHQGDGTLASATGLLNVTHFVDVKSQRRFRENMQTLWFKLQVSNAGLTGSATMIFKGRTLLRVP